MQFRAKCVYSVDQDHLRRAKLIAAKTDTSVDPILGAAFCYLTETFEADDASRHQNLYVLLNFALGRINNLITMKSLGDRQLHPAGCSRAKELACISHRGRTHSHTQWS